MKILLATTNPHKVEEIRAILAELAAPSPPQNLQLLGLPDVDPHRTIPEPVEDAPTFAGNALKKAQHYHAATHLPCLADDSGLEVDALAGAPGVISARYAGVTGPRSLVDPANNRLLMQNLRHVPAAQRTARFVCTMALITSAAAARLLARGTVEGRILTDAEAGPDVRGRGAHGFGYDPLFLVEELGRTTAELDPQHKNAISHRGRATRLLWPQLQPLLKS